jgi:HSP20 family protein
MKKTPISSKQSTHMPFSAIRSEINHLFDNYSQLLGQPLSLFPQSFDERNIYPSIDIVEDDKNYKIEAEMPGMGEEDIKITVDKNMLTIKGEKSTSKQDKDKSYLSREISYGYYERSISLPDYVDISQAKASFKKGMLWVTFPKNAEHSSQQRELKIEKAS